MQEIRPFNCTYSPQLPELLLNLTASIAISTYQAGKVVFISPSNERALSILPRTFEKPMGIATEGNRLAVACKDSIIELTNAKELATTYPNKPNHYDAIFHPVKTHHTGLVDMHDIAYSNGQLWAVNTSFSCLCTLDSEYNFTPVWNPPFISNLVAEDRCHLNGLVMENNQPKYVTALGNGDAHQSWREDIVSGGILMDVTTNEVLLDGLAMPHSPLKVGGKIYMLLSATGQLVEVDVEHRSYEVVKALDGFCRGLDIIGDYAFVGMSKLRKNSSTFAKLPFAEKATTAGIKVIHLPTRAFIGELNFVTSVDEIYEVKILQNTIKPNILNTINPIHNYALNIPNKTFWANPEQNQ